MFSPTRLNSGAKNMGAGIFVVDSNGVIDVRSCQHSGVEVGLDCGVTKLG